MFLFCDSFDHFLINGDDRINGKYATIGGVQAVRLPGRYDPDTDGNPSSYEDSAYALMNTAFGRISHNYSFAGLASGAVFFGVDIRPANLSGGAFATDSDFITLSGYDSFSSTFKEQAKIAIRNDGRLQVWKSTGTNFTGTMLAELPAGTLADNVWHRLEIRFTDSTLVLRLDGVEMLDLDDSMVSGTDGISRVGICWESFGNNAMVYDNLAVWDTSGALCNDWIGDAQVAANYVDDTEAADVPTGAWTPTTGTSLEEMVDERPIADANYHDFDTTVIEASADASVVFKCRRFFPYGEILGVAVNIVTKCPTATTLSAVVRGASDFVNTGISFSSSTYRIVQFPYTFDPEGGIQWQQDDFIDQRWRFGAALASPLGPVKITQLVVEVLHVRTGGPLAFYGVL